MADNLHNNLKNVKVYRLVYPFWLIELVIFWNIILLNLLIYDFKLVRVITYDY
jgi:hypothetical protein